MKLLALCVLLAAAVAGAQTGVLIPRDQQNPDSSVLSLEEMRVDVAIDNGDAHVSIVQIFANHTKNVEEGTYRFALPTDSTVSDFAVWDGAMRIPAVILERKWAAEAYDQARLQAIDPGLLEAGERDSKDPKTTALFTAAITPIPAYGTKRLELEYHQRIATADFKQFFVLPLQPDAAQRQAVHRFMLHFSLRSATAVEALETPAKLFAIHYTSKDAYAAEASFSGTDVALDEDFSATWHLAESAADQLTVITHREPHTPLPAPGSLAPQATLAQREPGFFAAQLLIGDPKPATARQVMARTVILLFDTSLSMQWEKLERSYAAFEATLRALHPDDRFNVLLFNQEVTPFQAQPGAATPQAIQQALAFVRASKLRGGTDLLKPLTAGVAQVSEPNTTLALFSDGGSNRGETVLANKIVARYFALVSKAPSPPHIAVFAAGDDANLPLLRRLAQNGGFVESVLSTEPVDFHLQSWLSKLVHTPVAGLTLNTSPAGQTSLIYPLDDAVYPGSVAQWVGQYQPSSTGLALTARAMRDGVAVEARAQVLLPAMEPAHPQLPRLWARARVDALLAQIDREGESTAAIEEIIWLSRRYKFVTPYTSFLAVPRSLLRPRVIRPGDPVLRVRTDAGITSVIALFPFGLTKPLRHLASEDLKAPGDEANRLWETRFLAPAEMKDGTYPVRLILRDSHGNTYREAKSFVIASTPPAVKIQLSHTTLHRGETLEVRALASASTRTLTAHLEGAAPFALRWNPRATSNTGSLTVPANLPVGPATLTVTAEDVAHNLGSQEVRIDVLP